MVERLIALFTTLQTPNQIQLKNNMTLVWHKLLQTIHLSFQLLNRNQELWVNMLLIQVCLRDLDEKINETVDTTYVINIGSGLADFSSVWEKACWTSECCHCVTIRRLWLWKALSMSVNLTVRQHIWEAFVFIVELSMHFHFHDLVFIESSWRGGSSSLYNSSWCYKYHPH